MNVLYKTKLCNYQMAGNCRHGSGCLHAHSEAEIRPSPDFRKTKLCRMFQKGICTSINCNRAHGEVERRIVDTFYKTKICKYWRDQGTCIRGSECYFAHNECASSSAGLITESPENQQTRLQKNQSLRRVLKFSNEPTTNKDFLLSLKQYPTTSPSRAITVRHSPEQNKTAANKLHTLNDYKNNYSDLVLQKNLITTQEHLLNYILEQKKSDKLCDNSSTHSVVTSPLCSSQILATLQNSYDDNRISPCTKLGEVSHEQPEFLKNLPQFLLNEKEQKNLQFQHQLTKEHESIFSNEELNSRESLFHQEIYDNSLDYENSVKFLSKEYVPSESSTVSTIESITPKNSLTELHTMLSTNDSAKLSPTNKKWSSILQQHTTHHYNNHNLFNFSGEHLPKYYQQSSFSCVNENVKKSHEQQQQQQYNNNEFELQLESLMKSILD